MKCLHFLHAAAVKQVHCETVIILVRVCLRETFCCLAFQILTIKPDLLNQDTAYLRCSFLLIAPCTMKHTQKIMAVKLLGNICKCEYKNTLMFWAAAFWYAEMSNINQNTHVIIMEEKGWRFLFIVSCSYKVWTAVFYVWIMQIIISMPNHSQQPVPKETVLHCNVTCAFFLTDSPCLWKDKELEAREIEKWWLYCEYHFINVIV